MQLKLWSSEGCPTRVRCDPGTENGIIGKSQMFLRRNGEDSLAGENSYYEGSSVVNQVMQERSIKKYKNNNNQKETNIFTKNLGGGAHAPPSLR